MQTALPYSVPSCVLLNDTRDAWKLEPATASQRGHHGKRTCQEGQLTGLRGHFDAREPLFYVIASITCPPAPFWRPKAYFCQRLLLQRALRCQIVARRRIPAARAHKPLPGHRPARSPQRISPLLRRRSSLPSCLGLYERAASSAGSPHEGSYGYRHSPLHSRLAAVFVQSLI